MGWRVVTAGAIAIAVAVAIGVNLSSGSASSLTESPSSLGSRDATNDSKLLNGVVQAPRGRGQQASARIPLHQKPDDGELLVVRVLNVETGELAQQGWIQLVPLQAFEFVPSQRSGEAGSWIASSQRMITDGASGRSTVLAEESMIPHQPIQGGEWRGPKRQEDTLVRCVRVGSCYGVIVEGEVIRAGASSALVSVRPMGFADLRVVDEQSGSDLNGVEIRAVRSGGSSVRGNMKFRLRLDGAADDIGTVEAQGVEPPQGAAILVSGGSSPVRVPLADHDRTLWVRSDGYAWGRLTVPAGMGHASVELERRTGLTISVVGAEDLRGSFELQIVKEEETLALWGPHRKSRSFTLNDVGEGKYGVILRHISSRGSVPLFAEEFEVRGHGLELALHALDLWKALPDTGGLSVLVHGGAPSVLVDTSLRLSVTPLVEGSRSEPFADVTLLPAEVIGPGRNVQFSSVPCGVYIVKLEPCGLRARISVKEGKTVNTSMDLSDLASVRVWPVDGDGSLIASPKSKWALRWRPSSLNGDPVSLGDEIDAAERRAEWNTDHWRLLSPSGTGSCVIVGEDGGSLSVAETYKISAGPQEIALEVNSLSVCELRLNVRGLTARELATLGQLLREGWTGGPRVRVRKRLPTGFQPDRQDRTLYLEFDRAGMYQLQFPAVGEKIPSRSGLIMIEVGRGKRPCIELEWR